MSAAALTQLSIETFAAGDIDAHEFDHAAHIYVAWLYLEKWPLLEAIDEFTTALKQLTTKLGVPGKYHETITWFFMFLIAERRQDSLAADWFLFARQNPDLFGRGEDNILSCYYSKSLLGSDRARESFALPDRLIR